MSANSRRTNPIRRDTADENQSRRSRHSERSEAIQIASSLRSSQLCPRHESPSTNLVQEQPRQALTHFMESQLSQRLWIGKTNIRRIHWIVCTAQHLLPKTIPFEWPGSMNTISG